MANFRCVIFVVAENMQILDFNFEANSRSPQISVIWKAGTTQSGNEQLTDGLTYSAFERLKEASSYRFFAARNLPIY